MYFTQISIGTPPQHFQVLVDISSSDTFVTSIDCVMCSPGGARYNPEASTSFHPNGTAIDIDYGWMLISGNISLDTFSFNNFDIRSQMFLNAHRVQPVGLSWDNIAAIHGIMGLTPSSAGSGLDIPSPFMTMVSQGILDENVFSLRLREPRELMFGGVNHNLFAGNITRIPLTHQTSRYGLTGRWQAQANYIAIGSTPGIRLGLDGLTASFSTSSAYILLPDMLVWHLLRDLEFEDIPFMPYSVSCDKRALLPDITFNLAGHNFTLTPHDWTFEWPIEGQRTRCVSALMSIGLPPHETKEIMLGSAFLRAFYSVFDLDKETVGCESNRSWCSSTPLIFKDTIEADYDKSLSCLND